MQKGRILVVDDDAFFRTVCSDILVNAGYDVKTASSGLEALSAIGNEDFDMVLTDLVMPDMSGLDVLERTKQINTLIDVVVVTGHGSLETAVDALKKGAFDYIRKPLNEEELLHTVSGCMEKKKLLEENIEMRQALNLFEATRNIVATIEINKLFTISLDAMLQVVPADAGMLAFYEEGPEEGQKKLDIKCLRHLDIKDAERLLEALKAGYQKVLEGLDEITAISGGELNEKDPEEFKGWGSLLIIPFVNAKGQTPMGFLLLLRKDMSWGYGLREVKNASFIAEHASSAFDNARKYSEAKGMAFIDSLTNLYNSKYLETALEKEIKRAERSLTPVTVLFMDLDNFKKINDTNDHLVGSKVLVEVARVILKNVREVDTVVRYGGDEYVVILVDADYTSAFLVADRIRAAVENHPFLHDEGLDIRITASIGMATYPVHTKDKKELLRMADKAMYRAKGISRNVVYLEPVPEG